MKNSHSRRLILALLASASVTATLSACNSTKKLIDGWTNDREPQRIEGERRLPQYNQQYIQNASSEVAPGTAKAAPAPMQEQKTEVAQKPVPSFEENPYDYFDDAGNSIEPKQAEPVMASEPVTTKAAGNESAQQSSDNFFSRMFGLNDTPSEVEKLRMQPRKPLMDNAYPAAPLAPAPVSNVPQEATMPIVAAPQNMDAAPVPMAAKEESVMLAEQYVPEITPVQEVNADESVAMVPPVEVSEARRKPNWFERNFGGLADRVSYEEAESAPVKTDIVQDDAEFPDLKSVPSTPEQFEQVKEEKQQDMEDMQAAHMQAQQESQALYSEPSSQEAVVPVMAAPPAAPAKPSVDMVYETGTQTASSDSGEVLLGHVSAPADAAVAPVAIPQEDPVEALATMPDAAPSMPAEKELVDAEEPAKPATALLAKEEPSMSQQNRWWEGWDIFSSKKYDSGDSVMAETTPETMPEAETVAVEEDASQLTPAATLQPMVEMPEPESIPAPMPVLEAEAQMPLEEASAETAEGLPSPQILKEVKMMPPSRYSRRLSTLQDNSQP